MARGFEVKASEMYVPLLLVLLRPTHVSTRRILLQHPKNDVFETCGSSRCGRVHKWRAYK